MIRRISCEDDFWQDFRYNKRAEQNVREQSFRQNKQGLGCSMQIYPAASLRSWLFCQEYFIPMDRP